MRTTFRARVGAAFAAIGGLAFVATTGADVALFRYEADVLPTDPSAGWTVGDPCGPTCSHTLANGVLSFHWPQAADLATYAYRIAEPPQPSHPSLWVEWRFRSNHIKGPNYFTCDAEFVVQYRETFEFIWMYADAAFDFGGDYGLVELDPAEFHLFRFESLDGAKYRVAVDGKIFKAAEVYLPGALDYIAFGGRGGCPSDQIPDMVNEWDMIRFGTIGFGEQIVSTDPPAGVLDPLVYPNLDRFLVTYDSPNYAYTDDITVEVFLGSDQATKRGTDEDGFRHEGTRARRHEAGAGDAQAEARERGKGSGEQGAPVSRGLAPVWPGAGGDEAPRRQVDPAAVPQVIATRRRDNGNPEDLEVVLDRPMPVGATTRFTFNDGVTQNVVEYTLGIPGICCLIGGGCAAAFDPTCTNAGGTFVPDGVCTDAQPCCLPSR
ncbi:MAG: hypothetical protein HY763_09025, partial [Planctomycetes bacterium]|nr:hypothetical protein [Planctomycetota bacterium]